MLKQLVYPVILSGGSGTRLWPLSRAALPKQFIALFEKHSLFQNTIERVKSKSLFQKPIIVGSKEHEFLIESQLQEIGVEPETMIFEPSGRNTAPAIALAASYLLENEPDAIMLVMPSDHVIKHNYAFVQSVYAAHEICLQNKLVTFGVEPDYPETGYGYIESGDKLDSKLNANTYKVEKFVEKPDSANAELMMKSGYHYWNSGIFMFSAKQYMNELAEYNHSIVNYSHFSYRDAEIKNKKVFPESNQFSKCDDISIDYAVMENTSKAAMIHAVFDWSDAGSWLSLWSLSDKDNTGNKIIGDVETSDTESCYIHSRNRLVSTIGVKDLIVVDTEDALLISDKSHVQDVKKVVANLKNKERTEATLPAVVQRPWGTYEGIHHGKQHQVKHITVEPEASLSLQYHNHRSEHWIVVAGEGEVLVGNKTLTLKANQSVYIEKGELHRLTNSGDTLLHLIEVQCGEYLGEDDIVRLEDMYGRVENKQVHSAA